MICHLVNFTAKDSISKIIYNKLLIFKSLLKIKGGCVNLTIDNLNFSYLGETVHVILSRIQCDAKIKKKYMHFVNLVLTLSNN